MVEKALRIYSKTEAEALAVIKDLKKAGDEDTITKRDILKLATHF